MSNIQLRNYLENFSKNSSLKRKKSISSSFSSQSPSSSSASPIQNGTPKCHKNIIIENGALKIVNNICGLCNKPFDDFVPHLINHNHINKQFLTKELCSALSLTSKFVSSSTTSFPLTIPKIQSLKFYFTSYKLPLYFEKLYTCHHCHVLFDSVNLLFNHLNNCDFKFQEVILISDDDDDDDAKDNSVKIAKDTPVLKNTISVPKNSTPVVKCSPSILKNSTLFSKSCSSPIIKNSTPASKNTTKRESPAKSALPQNNDDIDIASNITLYTPESFSKDMTKVLDKKLKTNISNCKPEINVHTTPTSASVNKIKTPIKITGNSDAIVLKPSSKQISIPSNTTPTKAPSKSDSNKNGFSPKQALQSRSNKRLLRNLKKPLIDYKPPPEFDNSDTIILNSLTKKNAWKNNICGSIFRHLKCKFCNRSNFKNEKNLQTHYQNFHKFVPVQTNSELLVSRVMKNNDLKKYYQYRCLSCLKMFENFTNLSQHRCKYYLRDAKQSLDKSNGKPIQSTKFVNNMNKPDEVIDYNSQFEFFKNLGLIRKSNIDPVVSTSNSSASQPNSTQKGEQNGMSVHSGTIVLNQISKNFTQIKKAGNKYVRTATNTNLCTYPNKRSTINTRKCNQDDMKVSLVPKPVNGTSTTRMNVVNPIPLANNMCINWNAQYPNSLITITPTNMPTIFKFPNNMNAVAVIQAQKKQPVTTTTTITPSSKKPQSSSSKPSVPITRLRR